MFSAKSLQQKPSSISPLFGTRLGAILMQKMQQDQTIESLLAKTFEDIDWRFKQTGPVHILSRKKGKVVQKSIIMRIEMPGVAVFYQQLKALGIIEPDTPLPPPHVTLYTLNCPSGIGVPSDKMLNTLSIKTLSVDTFYQLNV